MINVEETPNPLSVKFIPSGIVSEEPLEFNNIAQAKVSYLASDLFKLEGVTKVFLGRDFVAVNVKDAHMWPYVKPQVVACIEDYYIRGLDIINYNELISAKSLKQSQAGVEQSNCEIEKLIKEVIEERIRPAVAMDGGDVVFKGFSGGKVYLKLVGACAGCPSAHITLKNGIENILCYFVPEVSEVVAVDE